jgi:hypothetical protein
MSLLAAVGSQGEQAACEKTRTGGNGNPHPNARTMGGSPFSSTNHAYNYPCADREGGARVAPATVSTGGMTLTGHGRRLSAVIARVRAGGGSRQQQQPPSMAPTDPGASFAAVSESALSPPSLSAPTAITAMGDTMSGEERQIIQRLMQRKRARGSSASQDPLHEVRASRIGLVYEGVPSPPSVFEDGRGLLGRFVRRVQFTALPDGGEAERGGCAPSAAVGQHSRCAGTAMHDTDGWSC